MMLWLDTHPQQQGRPQRELCARDVRALRPRPRQLRRGGRAPGGAHVHRMALDPGGGFRVAARQHDDGVKTVLGRTGNFGGEDVIRLAAAQPASHRWVASRIWSRFGAHAAPTDDAITALLAGAPPKPLSELFRAVLLSPSLTTPERARRSAETACRVGRGRAAGARHDAAGQESAANVKQSGAAPLRPRVGRRLAGRHRLAVHVSHRSPGDVRNSAGFRR